MRLVLLSEGLLENREIAGGFANRIRQQGKKTGSLAGFRMILTPWLPLFVK